MEGLISRNATYFEYYQYIVENDNLSDFKILATSSLSQSDPRLYQRLISLHYELGLSLEDIAEYVDDIQPYRLREYSKSMAALIQDDFDDAISDTLITDGFQTASKTYFTFEYMLASGNNLDEILDCDPDDIDFEEIMPLLKSLSYIPDNLVLYLARHNISLQDLPLTGEQLDLSRRIKNPKQEDVIRAYDNNVHFTLFGADEMVDGKLLMYVVLDHVIRHDIEQLEVFLEDCRLENRHLLDTAVRDFLNDNLEAVYNDEYNDIIKKFLSAGVNQKKLQYYLIDASSKRCSPELRDIVYGKYREKPECCLQ